MTLQQIIEEAKQEFLDKYVTTEKWGDQPMQFTSENVSDKLEFLSSAITKAVEKALEYCKPEEVEVKLAQDCPYCKALPISPFCRDSIGKNDAVGEFEEKYKQLMGKV